MITAQEEERRCDHEVCIMFWEKVIIPLCGDYNYAYLFIFRSTKYDKGSVINKLVDSEAPGAVL